jgi:hypothetical protein
MCSLTSQEIEANREARIAASEKRCRDIRANDNAIMVIGLIVLAVTLAPDCLQILRNILL